MYHSHVAAQLAQYPSIQVRIRMTRLRNALATAIKPSVTKSEEIIRQRHEDPQWNAVFTHEGKLHVNISWQQKSEASNRMYHSLMTAIEQTGPHPTAAQIAKWEELVEYLRRETHREVIRFTEDIIDEYNAFTMKSPEEKAKLVKETSNYQFLWERARAIEREIAELTSPIVARESERRREELANTPLLSRGEDEPRGRELTRREDTGRQSPRVFAEPDVLGQSSPSGDTPLLSRADDDPRNRKLTRREDTGRQSPRVFAEPDVLGQSSPSGDTPSGDTPLLSRREDDPRFRELTRREDTGRQSPRVFAEPDVLGQSSPSGATRDEHIKSPDRIQSPNPAVNTGNREGRHYSTDYLLQFQEVFEEPSTDWVQRFKDTFGDSWDPTRMPRPPRYPGGHGGTTSRQPSNRGEGKADSDEVDSDKVESDEVESDEVESDEVGSDVESFTRQWGSS